ncbi:hypothetical protein BV898_11349 [Hypsibius exemplaris]|uniref:Uncharacterized protein n=1 Tax=Hypsibius exemplaris TaxID=2072580 RepID=A0A1W0WH38_HYPEX|nr:hypothetical protein BV898_11349 [Hypsibius exemplaris]
MPPIRTEEDYYPPVNRITHYPKAPAAVRREPSIATTGQTVRATDQRIHSYTNAKNQHLQEQIPPTKPYIGLRRAYRPGYAICVIIGGIINLVSGIIMTALAYSARSDLDNDAVKVLKVLGPVVIVIGIIFLLCGLVLLFHFRKTQAEERELRDRGHGFYDRPSHRDLPAYSTDAASIPTQAEDYSLYDEIARTSHRRQQTPRRPPPAPSSVEPAGGDWKYVSDIKDATLSPSRYPRELRRSERRPGEDAHQYRMYPYDKSYKTGNGAALPQHIPNSGKPPRIRNSYPPRQQEPLQRY